jgi:itaconyl-CoA hydratase
MATMQGGRDCRSESVVILRRVGSDGDKINCFRQGPGEDTVATREGWRGRFFEDFEVGDIYEHPLGRTVTTTDNMWFTLLTQNTAPIHVDHAYAALTEFGRPLVDSTFTVALVTGQSVTDVSQNVFANLGWDEIRLPAPVFEGDTIYSRSEVLEKRESRSRPDVGIVKVKTTGYNQDGKTVITFQRTVMVYRRDHAPRIPRPAPEE